MLQDSERLEAGQAFHGKYGVVTIGLRACRIPLEVNRLYTRQRPMTLS